MSCWYTHGCTLPRGGRPAQRVGDGHFDLAHALVAVGEHALVPLRVQHAGAGFERHLFGERAHRAFAARLVADVHRRDRGGVAFGLLRALHGAADATQRVEVGVDGRDAQFYGIEVLVGQVHARQHAAQQLRVCWVGLPLRP